MNPNGHGELSQGGVFAPLEQVTAERTRALEQVDAFLAQHVSDPELGNPQGLTEQPVVAPLTEADTEAQEQVIDVCINYARAFSGRAFDFLTELPLLIACTDLCRRMGANPLQSHLSGVSKRDRAQFTPRAFVELVSRHYKTQLEQHYKMSEAGPAIESAVTARYPDLYETSEEYAVHGSADSEVTTSRRARLMAQCKKAGSHVVGRLQPAFMKNNSSLSATGNNRQFERPRRRRLGRSAIAIVASVALLAGSVGAVSGERDLKQRAVPTELADADPVLTSSSAATVLGAGSEFMTDRIDVASSQVQDRPLRIVKGTSQEPLAGSDEFATSFKVPRGSNVYNEMQTILFGDSGYRVDQSQVANQAVNEALATLAGQNSTTVNSLDRVMPGQQFSVRFSAEFMKKVEKGRQQTLNLAA